MARGISRCGTFASSTTLAKSSKPMNAKKASKLPKPMPDKVTAFERRRVGDRRGNGKVCMDAGDDDGDQAADLDEREQARKHDRFQNAPRGHRAKRENNDHDDQALREIDELPDIAGRPERNGGR